MATTSSSKTGNIYSFFKILFLLQFYQRREIVLRRIKSQYSKNGCSHVTKSAILNIAAQFIFPVILRIVYDERHGIKRVRGLALQFACNPVPVKFTGLCIDLVHLV